MIRLLMLLCAGLFLTLQIGGQDRGQVRAGLKDADVAPTRSAQTMPAQAPELQVADPAPAAGMANVAAMPVVFAPAQPLITPVAQPEMVVQAAAESETPAEEMAEAETSAREVRYVTGRSVNVRSGPSTRNGVVGRLTRGEAVSVVWVEENGWARVRVEGDGVDGYMAMSFLADSAP